MSDLESLISSAPLTDPYVTRVLVRRAVSERLLDGLEATTSVSFLAVDDAVDMAGQLAAAKQGTDKQGTDKQGTDKQGILEGIRAELVVVADDDSAETASKYREIVGRGVRSKIHRKPLGGRASALAEGVERSANEFIVVAGASSGSLAGLPLLLRHMWIDGADIGVMGPGDYSQATGLAAVDVAAAVPQWLGMSGGAARRCSHSVVMRRWVARWIFNEISRSISPAEELADRIRLLGVAIVYMASEADDAVPVLQAEVHHRVL